MVSVCSYVFDSPGMKLCYILVVNLCTWGLSLNYDGPYTGANKLETNCYPVLNRAMALMIRVSNHGDASFGYQIWLDIGRIVGDRMGELAC